MFSSLVALFLAAFLSGHPNAVPARQVFNQQLSAAPRHIVVTEKQMSASSLAYTATASVPQVQGLRDPVAQQRVNAALMEFAKKWMASLGGEVQDESPGPDEPRASFGLLYDTAQANDAVVSVLFTMYSDTGGAHPNENFMTFTYDVQAGKELALSDLFAPRAPYLQRLSSIAAVSLTQQLTASEGQMPDTQWIAEGTAPIADNFRSFTLTKTALQLHFDPYQVASHADGPQEVDIPYAQLQDILSERLKSIVSR